jgi:hypothetical protein
MRYRIVPYSGGSDHGVFVARPIAIPGIMIGHEDPYWHSSLDTIEKCDPTELKRVISIALCTSYIFSIQNRESIISIWPILERSYYQRLGKVKEMLFSLFNKLNQENITGISKDDIALIGKSLIELYLTHERSVLDSVKNYDILSPIIEEFYNERTNNLEELKKELLALWTILCKHANIEINQIQDPDYLKQKWVINFIGRKNLKFYIPFLLSNEYQEFKAPEPPDVWGGDAQEMLNFIGLSLNLKEICAMLTLEFQDLFTPNSVLNFAKLFEKEGFISRV